MPGDNATTHDDLDPTHSDPEWTEITLSDRELTEMQRGATRNFFAERLLDHLRNLAPSLQAYGLFNRTELTAILADATRMALADNHFARPAEAAPAQEPGIRWPDDNIEDLF